MSLSLSRVCILIDGTWIECFFSFVDIATLHVQYGRLGASIDVILLGVWAAPVMGITSPWMEPLQGN